MIRIIAKLFAVTIVLTAFLHVAPLFAVPITWISNTGNDSSNDCSATNPCQTIQGGLAVLDNFGQVSCLNAPRTVASIVFGTSSTIDCASVWQPPMGAIALALVGNLQTKIRNVTFSGGTGGLTAIKVTGSGTLIFENCVLENLSGAALDIEPNGPLTLVITNSRMSNNASGMLLKPAAGGSIKATFDHVVITSSTGGGIKSDSTNGVVNLDVSDSEISNNGGNGINLVGSANQNMLNVSRTIIAKNAVAGLQVNGATTAALVDTTLFDTNTSGATSVVGGGHVLTYANNRIVGSAGSGFTGPAALQ
jgi:hypothetical protein